MGKRVGDRGVNSWLGGGDFLAGAVIGSIASAFGGMAGQWASRGANVLINGFNITSPVISGVVAGGTAGAAAGFASGFVASGEVTIEVNGVRVRVNIATQSPNMEITLIEVKMAPMQI